MSHPRLITENMLDDWIRGNSQDAQGVTVELIWRLLSASCPAPIHRRFPLGDSIGQHGSDGELETVVGFAPFAPDGKSFWEIGTSVNANAKVNSDYNETTAAIPSEIRKVSLSEKFNNRVNWLTTDQIRGLGVRVPTAAHDQ